MQASKGKFRSRLLTGAQWALVGGFLFFPVFLALGNIAIILAALLSLLVGDWRARWALVREIPVLRWALGLYAVVLLGTLYSPAPNADILLHLNKYGKLLVVPLLLPLLAQEKWRRRCLGGFVVAMVFILISIYVSLIHRLPWMATQSLDWGVNHTVAGDHITQNVMLSFFALLAFVWARQERRVVQRVVAGVGCILTVVAITQLSDGRTGYVSVIIALLTGAFFSFRGYRRWMILGCVFLMIGIALGSSTAVRQRVALGWDQAVTSQDMKTTSIGGRINFWKYTTELIVEKPVMGWGTGSYHSVWCEHMTQGNWCQYGGWHPHNQYLFFWMENGLLGVMLFILLVATPAWSTRHAAIKDRPILWGFSAIFAVDSLINSPLFSARESHFFIMLLIYLGAMAYWRDTDAGGMSK